MALWRQTLNSGVGGTALAVDIVTVDKRGSRERVALEDSRRNGTP